MYANISKLDTINLITDILNGNSEIAGNNQEEIIHILKTVTEQNYFKFNKKYAQTIASL
jgi:hypothetical protein